MFYYYKGAFSWHRENQNLTSQAALPLVAACIYNADWVLQPGVRGLGPWSHIGKTTRSKQRPVNDLVALCLSRSLWIFPRCSLVLFVQDAPFDQAGEEPMGADPHCAALLRSAHSRELGKPVTKFQRENGVIYSSVTNGLHAIIPKLYLHFHLLSLKTNGTQKKNQKAAHWTVLKQEKCHSLMRLIPACMFVLFWGTRIVVKSQETLSQFF